jgi:hypothetical protein
MHNQPTGKLTTPRTFTSAESGTLLQRACSCGQHSRGGGECKGCMQKRNALQRAAVGQAAPDVAPPIVHEVLQSPGQPLDGGTRGLMESRFGSDFSRVRVHTTDQADESAREVSALAYTVGQHVIFSSGKYAPATLDGQLLLAHELVHTIQQSDWPSYTSALAVEGSFGASEREAGLVSRLVLQKQAGNVLTRTGVQVARQPDEVGVREGGGESTQSQSPAPLHIAGRQTPDREYKIIRIAWTLDDGPTAYTETMRTTLGRRSGTWFIMRNMLGTGQELQTRLAGFVRRQQDSREEIAIHSMHPTQGHVAWFPVRVSGGVPQGYQDINQAMQHLREFTQLLRDAGLSVHFVRLPGGLISELVAYLGAQGIPDGDRRSLAERIIRGEDVTRSAPAATSVQNDYRILQDTLVSLNMRLWGGGSGPQVTAPQSWEAESSGTGLTDDVTSRFNRLVGEFARVHRARSMIVLAHDTAQENAAEVGRDVDAMERYAEQNGVRVEYYNLSDLYRIVRGEEL